MFYVQWQVVTSVLQANSEQAEHSSSTWAQNISLNPEQQEVAASAHRSKLPRRTQ